MLARFKFFPLLCWVFASFSIPNKYFPHDFIFLFVILELFEVWRAKPHSRRWQRDRQQTLLKPIQAGFGIGKNGLNGHQ